MKVFLSKYVGFCGGVSRSVAMAYAESKRCKGTVYTDGELVHNSSTLDELAHAGISKLQDGQKLCKARDSIIVRAHGITPARREMLNALCDRVIDATCPRVLKVAGLIKKYSTDGYQIILIGDDSHPEVIGLCGYAHAGNVKVLSSVEEALNLEIFDAKMAVLSQTTFEHGLFRKIVDVICERFASVTVHDTTCPAASCRQEEVLRLIKSGCDCIVIVGSEFSKNTHSLRRVAERSGCTALVVESAENQTVSEAEKYSHIGIISGTSTNWRDVDGVRKKLLLLISE
jgi:4-hydroxy-3-methylbut-2-enyl diphosphate reductase